MFFDKALSEGQEWAKILKCSMVDDLNRIIDNGEIGELIRVSEALHEKRIANIADKILQGITSRRVILIAGPSSSGKTSFTQRLKVQLRVLGLEPVSISVDDYFINREEVPKKADGTYDFEEITVIDLPFFNEHLKKLLAGEEIDVPKFDFKTGKRIFLPNRKIKINARQPILLEGIHCLNDRLTSEIGREEKFKIYVSALTPLSMTPEVRLSTTKTRLFRRLVRDYRHRGKSAALTLKTWPSVLEGERKNIYPFQEDADEMFNSALLYELAVLKKYAMYILAEIEPENEMFATAQELLAFCRYFRVIVNEEDIANTSILREFIGGSCFDVG